MRSVALILLAVALGAASPLGDADSDPEALITAIYQSYTDIAPGEDGMPNVEGVFSARLQALIDKDQKETPEGEVGRIDWDGLIPPWSHAVSSPGPLPAYWGVSLCACASG